MIDKDINFLKAFTQFRYVNDDEVKKMPKQVHKDISMAIENVLKELETYKKIARRLAKEILSYHDPIFNMVTVNNMEVLIEAARKEVEKDD